MKDVKNLIDRYVYAVIKELPSKQRGDIEKELRSLIGDMVEEYQGEVSYEKKVEKVLLDLGDPKVLADNYRGSKKYLIGPESYDTYIFVLKAVALALFLAITIANVIGGVFLPTQNPIEGFIEGFGEYFSSLFSALAQGFVWVTLIFAIAERRGVKLRDKSEDSEWSLSKLSEIPQKESLISRWESVFSIIFLTVFVCVVWFSPQLLGAYTFKEGVEDSLIPMFNLEAYLPTEYFS